MNTAISRAVALAVVLGCAASTFAQMGTGRVTGSTKDTQGNPIEGAVITASDGSGKTYEATSDKSEQVGHHGLPQGQLRVHVPGGRLRASGLFAVREPDRAATPRWTS